MITQATYFDAKCAGDDADWADLAYDKSTPSTTELLRRSCSCSCQAPAMLAHALAPAPALACLLFVTKVLLTPCLMELGGRTRRDRVKSAASRV